MTSRESQLIELLNHYAGRLLYIAKELDNLPEWRLLAEADVERADALLRGFREELAAKRMDVAA